MKDNLELIKPLLNFNDKEDFYWVLILKRKKDQSTDRANHQSVRTIKSYCIHSIEELEERYDEMKKLSDLFNARTCIYINKKNHNDISLNLIQLIVERIKSGKFNQQYIFDSIVGSISSKEKRWIVDIDTKDRSFIQCICNYINTLRPTGGDKIEEIIPTPNGVHLITKPFDRREFFKEYCYIEVHENNPTILYYPFNFNKK